MSKFIERLSIPQTIVLSYTLIILLGTILLALPIASADRTWTSFLDAFFSSTSAVTVTGVTILDTATYWSYFGKTVLLLLIEIGGLGFMAIWVLFYQRLRGQPNLKQRRITSESLNLESGDHILEHVWYILRFALIVQLVGALLLAFAFIPEYGTLEGAYYAIFHSVSAFTNGGLDLFPGNLADFQTHNYVLIVMMLLIVTGGLGFIVWDDVLKYPKKKKLSIYTKIVLITTSLLWIFGTLFFWLGERNTGTFDHLSVGDQILNYMMLSVTTRSSGFTNVSFTELSLSSIILTNVLIFIGASSGSTGGGIKVSTLAVVFIALFRSFQGKNRLSSIAEFHKQLFSDPFLSLWLPSFLWESGLSPSL